MISPSLRPLPDNTQHSQETDILASRGIRTRSPIKWAAADPRFRQRGHRARLIVPLVRHYCFVLLFSWRYNPSWLCLHSPVAGFSLLVFEVSWSHTTTRHSRYDSPGRVINPSQRPLPDNTQHSQQTNIHVPGEIRTHNLSRRAAEELRLRPRGHWDRQSDNFRVKKSRRIRRKEPPRFSSLLALFPKLDACKL